MNKNNVSNLDINKQVSVTEYLQREEELYHHSYDEELLQYEYLRDGDLKSVEESKRLFRTGITGHLSDDPVRDKKYLFVASITLATRFAIEGGMDAQEAYNMSDSFIQRMDRLDSVTDIYELQTEMIKKFTLTVRESRSNRPLSGGAEVSRQVWEAMDYIYYHLHERITVNDVASAVSLSPNYLNHLFTVERGQSIQKYISGRKIDAAKNMLMYSDYTVTQISAILAYSSVSHFISSFKKATGKTPRDFSRKNFRKHDPWTTSQE